MDTNSNIQPSSETIPCGITLDLAVNLDYLQNVMQALLVSIATTINKALSPTYGQVHQMSPRPSDIIFEIRSMSL